MDENAPGCDITLIVVNYCSDNEVDDLIESLCKCPPSCNWEMIVVNAGPESRWQAAPPELPLQIINLEQNNGFGAAVNCALPLARGRYLLPMNSDIIFMEDCLPGAVAYLDEHEDTGILVPRLLTGDGELQYSARTFYSLATIMVRRTPLGKLLPGITRRHLYQDRNHETIFPVDWGQGAALLVRRGLVQEGKLFDERFFLYFEDVDLCARSWAQGLQILYYPPLSLVHHHRRESAASPFGSQGRQHLRSLMRFWRKWGTLNPRRED